MPTTVTGLLLFVALLLPGFVYVIIVQRHRPQRRISVLQETAAVAFVSVLADLSALAAFGAVRALAPLWTPDIDALVRSPGGYFSTHYLSVSVWALGLLATACAIAAGTGWVITRRSVHPSITSSWWTLFDLWQPGTTRHIQCHLDDGSYVSGELGDWNTMGEDSPDRDLILKAPITYRPAGAIEYYAYPVSAVCVSARHIVTMFVAYSDYPATSVKEGVAVEAAAALSQAVSPASDSVSGPAQQA